MTVDYWRGYRRPKNSDLPSGWESKQLRDIAKTCAGGRLGLTMADFQTSGNPAFSAEGQSGYVTPTEFDGPAVIVSSIGEQCGKCFFVEGPFSTLANVQVIFPDIKQINPYFLWNLFNNKRFWPRAQTAQPFIRPSDIKKAWVPIPQDGEQEAISMLLRLTDKAIAKAESELSSVLRLKTALMQTLFTKGIPNKHTRTKTITIFRKPVDIPFDWEPSRLGPNVTLVQYGTNSPANDSKIGYPVIAIPQVIKPRLALGDVPYADLPDIEAQALRLAEDDVLLIRTNGNPHFMGKSTVVTTAVASQHVVFASYLIRIRTNRERLLGTYLSYFLVSPLGRKQALAMANTSAGNHNLGARSLKQFWLPRPDIDEQEKIVELISGCDDSIDSLDSKLKSLNDLKKSLLQNLLTGRVRIKPGGIK